MFSTLSLNLKKNLPAEAGAVPDFVSLPILINPARVTVTGNRAWDTHTGEESERKHGRNFWRKCGFFHWKMLSISKLTLTLREGRF